MTSASARQGSRRSLRSFSDLTVFELSVGKLTIGNWVRRAAEKVAGHVHNYRRNRRKNHRNQLGAVALAVAVAFAFAVAVAVTDTF